MLTPNTEYELIESGLEAIVGIDEVGRGAWAGPLYLGAYIFFKNSPTLDGINDSKLLSKRKRANLFADLKQHEHLLYPTEANKIDELGLGKALNLSVEYLVKSISKKYNGLKIKFLVDGQFSVKLDEFDVEFIKKGDTKIYSIACASILAKETRDNEMTDMSVIYPNYSFDKHVGYGTKDHIMAIEKHGAIKNVHRFSYKSIKNRI